MALFGAIVAPMLVASAWSCVAIIGRGSGDWRRSLASSLPTRVELALRSLYTWVPAALSLAAAAFLRYPIDRATHVRLASARD